MRTRKKRILAELRWRLEDLRWSFSRIFGRVAKVKQYQTGLRWQMNELRWRASGLNRTRRVKPSELAESVTDLPWQLLGNKRRLIGSGFVGLSMLGVGVAVATVTVTAVTAPENTTGIQTVVERLVASPEEISAPSLPYVYDDRVGSGDTMQSIFRRLGVSDARAMAFLAENQDAARAVQQLRSGSSLTVVVDISGRLLSMRLPATASGNSVEISRSADNQSFQISNTPIALESGTEMRRGVIKNSLFAATETAGLPDSIAKQLADLFGTEIDFHSDLRPGDTFSVIYRTLYDRGVPTQAGQILAAEFINQGVRYTVFHHTTTNGHSDYYTSNGQTLRSSFLRSPLDFSRVTSTFGRRMHPVFKSWHNHSGVDFGAPIGTPVRAASDGEVTFVGRYGGYGKLIILKHRDNISTHYGHLNAFAPGLSVGENVRQGEIIGEVGATGRVTAPHLHYEFRINDVAVNPMTAVLPDSAPLKGQELARFRENTRLQLARLEMLGYRIASSENEGGNKL
jgi:murein DD-endopeptidase MepM/ murein hydrolase activator NlpD